METLHEFESEFLAKLQTEQQTDPTLSATRLFKRLDKVRAHSSRGGAEQAAQDTRQDQRGTPLPR